MFGEGGVNSYAYCQGNPIDYVDPTGNWRLLPVWLSKLGSRLFGSTAKGGAMPARAATKAPKTSTNAVKPVVGKTAKRVNRVNNRKPKKQGAVQEGQIKGGFWDNQPKLGIQTTQNVKNTFKSEVPKTAPAGSKPSSGQPWGEMLENPKSGLEQFQKKLEKSWLNESVQRPTAEGGAKQSRFFDKPFEERISEDMKSVRGNVQK